MLQEVWSPSLPFLKHYREKFRSRNLFPKSFLSSPKLILFLSLSLSLPAIRTNFQRISEMNERGLTNEIVGERFSCFSRSSSRHRNIFEISSYRVPTSIGFSQHRDDDTSCDRSASKLPTYSRYAFVRETGIGRRVLDERGRGKKKGEKREKTVPKRGMNRVDPIPLVARLIYIYIYIYVYTCTL